MNYPNRLFVLLMLMGACVTTPATEVTDRKAFIIFPESQMAKMGAQAYSQIDKEHKKSNDPKLTAMVRQLGKELEAVIESDLNWEFNLYEAPDTINAFALPGGYVSIYTGILPVAKTNAGLAAIVGHEIAHVIARHGAERMSQAAATQAGLIVANVSLGDGKYRGMILQALGLGAQMGILLPYSRTHEKESDILGMLYMAEAGYDPREAIGVWQRMSAAGGKNPPEFMSTHPHVDTRIKELQKRLPEALAIYEKSKKIPTKLITLAKK